MSRVASNNSSNGLFEMALSATKTQLRLKLLMLWLAVAFGHLSHTTSHYLDSDIFYTDAAHENEHTDNSESSHEHEHEHEHEHQGGACVTCIAFVLVVLELARSAVNEAQATQIVFLVAKTNRLEHRGIQIFERPNQARAPPQAA